MSRQQQTSEGVLVVELCMGASVCVGTQEKNYSNHRKLCLESGIIRFDNHFIGYIHTYCTHIHLISLECKQGECWLTLNKSQGTAAKQTEMNLSLLSI